ncbi:MAG: hypothetical protein HYX64_08605 [Gammaproteobacteria bacterium]|nr:hypothetical protein [Gammaproteobacteria bacterium]
MCSTCDLRRVIRTALKQLGDWSPAAENLLLGTALQESGHSARLREGRRLGIYRISPAAHRAVWDKYLVGDPELASRVRGLAGQHGFLCDPHGELATNLKYATAIAWMIYRRHGQNLPDAEDIAGLARHWHRHFHSRPSGSAEDFVSSYLGATARAHAA